MNTGHKKKPLQLFFLAMFNLWDFLSIKLFNEFYKHLEFLFDVFLPNREKKRHQ